MTIDNPTKNPPPGRASPARRPKIAILAPLGWCVRNWVLSDVLVTLAADADVVVFSPEAKALAASNKIPNVAFEWMDVKPLGRLGSELNTLIQWGHYYRQRSYIQMSVLNHEWPGWTWRFRQRIRIFKLFSRVVVARMPAGLLEWIEKTFFGLGEESRRIEAVLKHHRVEMVHSTLPLIAHYERPTLWAAERLGLRSTAMISSWDNLFSKGRLPVRFSHYLVWSERMRDDLRSVYPAIRGEQITPVGPPQFDFYRRPGIVRDRAEFIRSIGGDPARKLVLWSGASGNQMPTEPDLLAQFCGRLRELPEADRPQVLVRPHPIGGGARFQRVRDQYPELLFTETNSSDPKYLIRWTPYFEDVELLVNSIVHASVNINLCSTMTLDCCALGRPVVNVAFDITPGTELDHYARDVYHYDHYRSVVELGAVQLVYSMDELVRAVSAYLENPELHAEGRARLLQHQCGDVDGRAGRRAAQQLLALARATQATPVGAAS